MQSRNNYAGQINLFDNSEEKNEVKIEKSNRKVTKQLLFNMEKEVLGMFVSGHPLEEYLEYIKENATVTTKDIVIGSEEDLDKINKYDQKEVRICGIIDSCYTKYTKKNETMMFAIMSDMYSQIELVLFPKTYANYSSFVSEGNIVFVKGKAVLSEEDITKILVTEVKKISKTEKIYIKIPKDRIDMLPQVESLISDISDEFYGSIPVYLFLEGTNKMKMMPRDKWLSGTDELMENLKLRFGDTNVVKK